MPNMLATAIALLFFCLGLFTVASAEQPTTVPGDFRIELTTGSVHGFLADETNRITVDASGKVTMGAWDSPYGKLPADHLTLGPGEVGAILYALDKARFWELKDDYSDPRIAGGDGSTISAVAGGRSKSVRVENMRVRDFDAILDAVNKYLPTERWLLHRAMFDDQFQQADR